jgi:hypothetical protein
VWQARALVRAKGVSVNEQERVKAAQEVKRLQESMEENLPMMLEHFALQAQVMKAKYDALRKHGFTEDQAIKLCGTL